MWITARTRRRVAAPRPRAWLVPATSLVLAAMPLPGCGHDMVEPDDEPDLRLYGDYTTLPMEQYASVCADIKADCIGKKCGCALADHAVVTGPERMSAEELTAGWWPPWAAARALSAAVAPQL